MPAASTRQPPRLLLRRHPAASTHWRLGWCNIYVLPTRAGWLLLALLLVLLVASVNYQLSLGFLLTFLLAGSIAAGVGMAHANLRGLQLTALPPEPVFAGQTVRLQLRLHAPGDRPGRTRRAVFVALGDRPRASDTAAWSGADIEAGNDMLLELGFPALQRGRHALPRVTVQTLFPLGAFRLWSHWQPAQQVLVYPAPETPPPPLVSHHASETGSGSQARATVAAEPDGVRAYQRGDPLRHIVWKKAAQALSTGSDQLVSRDRHASTQERRWLDAAATGLSHPEARLSRLTAWVQQVHQQQGEWGLRLTSGLQIAPGHGSAHYHHCLQALALEGLPGAAEPQQ